MLSELYRLRKAISLRVATTFALTPAVCFAAAVYLGFLSLGELWRLAEKQWFLWFIAAMLVWAFFHFFSFLDPVFKWIAYDRNNQDAPLQLHKRLSFFSRSYWTLFALYAIVSPLLINLSLQQTLTGRSVAHTLGFILLQLALTYLVAIPTYLKVHDELGRLVRFLGINRVYNALETRFVQVGAVIPVLSLTLFSTFYLRSASDPEWQVIAAALGLALFSLASTNAITRSIRSALLPVQKILGRSGATANTNFSNLKPQSTDEIGYLTQAIGKVFKRLADQQSHMHAIVGNAAEGIIVVDSKGIVDTFNLAAERLFGYNASEARGLSLSRLLPALTTDLQTPHVADGEQEIEGIHRSGRHIAMSVRVSTMQRSGETMFTCMVADITARKAAQRKQKKAEARYRDLVETAHDLVWITDADGRWIYLNNAAKTIYGLEPEAMLGRNISEFRDPSYASQESAAFDEILSGKELQQFETVHLDKDGKAHYLSFNAKAQCDLLGNVQQITGTARDISEKKAYEKQLAYQAEHDVLTGLYNRRYFQRELERVTARVMRSAATCGLLYIDLDQFKYINDTLGHAAGDRLLVEIADLLSNNMREGELLARFGGDEFTMLLYNIAENNLYSTAEKFRNLFHDYKFFHTGNAINITCSIGVALLDSSIKSAEEIMAHADMACHMAKSGGRNCVYLYNPGEENEKGMAADMGWASRVKDMLNQDRMIQTYQPIVSIETGQIDSYEVLLRMPCDDGPMILPGGFLPAAERFGLIQNIDRWVTQKSIEHLDQLHQRGERIRLSINLSGHAFDDKSLLPLIRKLLHQSALDPAYLTFEITESAAIKNMERAVRLISELKELGCRFALDDFGSGFNSFTYLKHLPVDIIKIDGSFVKDITSNQVDHAMVTSMNQIAHALGKTTIAEWVENIETYNTLKEIGVDHVQGFYLGRPEEKMCKLRGLPTSHDRISA